MMYRRYRTPSMWQEMDRLQHEMNRLYDTLNPSRFEVAPSFPAINIWVNENGLIVTSEVPGIEPENMDISVVNEMLTISGEREAEVVDTETRYHRQERGFGKFARTIQLPLHRFEQGLRLLFEIGIVTDFPTPQRRRQTKENQSCC